MRYGVWCEVWGGVTGARAAWLKENGALATFGTIEAARAEAARIEANLSPYRTAEFRYTAMPLGEEAP